MTPPASWDLRVKSSPMKNAARWRRFSPARQRGGSERVEDVLEGIDRVVVQAHFVVQVGAGGAAGRTDVGDDVAALTCCAGPDRVRRKWP